MNDYTLELSNRQIGALYMSLDDDLRSFLDNVIRYNYNKISTIKFLRSRFGISLAIAKIMYEGRRTFLTTKPNPFGWV